jgi:hypothetical protein
MIETILAQLPPGVPLPSSSWEFWAVIGYLTIQSLVQMYQLRQASEINRKAEEIKVQTNGLVASSVKSAGEAGHAAGQLAGVVKEQIRAAAVLALSDEVAAAKLVVANEVEAAKLALANHVAAHLAELKKAQP